MIQTNVHGTSLHQQNHRRILNLAQRRLRHARHQKLHRDVTILRVERRANARGDVTDVDLVEDARVHGPGGGAKFPVRVGRGAGATDEEGGGADEAEGVTDDETGVDGETGEEGDGERER